MSFVRYSGSLRHPANRLYVQRRDYALLFARTSRSRSPSLSRKILLVFSNIPIRSEPRCWPSKPSIVPMALASNATHRGHSHIAYRRQSRFRRHFQWTQSRSLEGLVRGGATRWPFHCTGSRASIVHQYDPHNIPKQEENDSDLPSIRSVVDDRRALRPQRRPHAYDSYVFGTFALQSYGCLFQNRWSGRRGCDVIRMRSTPQQGVLHPLLVWLCSVCLATMVS